MQLIKVTGLTEVTGAVTGFLDGDEVIGALDGNEVIGAVEGK